MRVRSPHRYDWVVGAGMLLAATIWVLSTVLLPLRQVAHARSWRSAPGTLQDIYVACAKGPPIPAFSLANALTCYPHAKYVFRVRELHIIPGGIADTDRVYSGTAITFADIALASGADQALTLERYHPGAAVQVFYNPRRPWQAVLERRVPLPAQVWWIGGLLSGSGGLILILGLRQNRAVIRRWRRIRGR